MTNDEVTKVYTKVFSFIIDNKLDETPLSLSKICEILKIQLVPLSEIVKSTTLTSKEIFEIWGNDDGVLTYDAQKNCLFPYKIAYNDSKPYGRLRFTIAEEISHVLLGHVEDPAFNVFNQTYNMQDYEKYDMEARTASGVLLLSPKFYYNYKNMLTLDLICERFQITTDCAKVRCQVYDKYIKLITSHHLYPFLPDPSHNQYEII